MSPATSSSYRERLWLPWYAWLLGLVFVAAIFWIWLLPLDFLRDGVPVSFVVGMAVLLVVVVGALSKYSATDVLVDHRGFQAGRALLPWDACGAATALSGEEARQAAGPDANANDYLLLRGYCGGAVRVDVQDEHDVTPHWLVSTRHPANLAAAINAHRVQD